MVPWWTVLLVFLVSVAGTYAFVALYMNRPFETWSDYMSPSDSLLFRRLDAEMHFRCEAEIGCSNPAIFSAVCRHCRHVYLWCGTHLHVRATLVAAGYPLQCRSCGAVSTTFLSAVDVQKLKKGASNDRPSVV